MCISYRNFQMVSRLRNTQYKSVTFFVLNGTIDIVTKKSFFSREVVETVEIYCDSLHWKFRDTNKFTPKEVYNLITNWAIDNHFDMSTTGGYEIPSFIEEKDAVCKYK